MLLAKTAAAIGAVALGLGGVSFAVTGGHPERYAQAVKEEGCPIRAAMSLWNGQPHGAGASAGVSAAATGPVVVKVEKLGDGVQVRLTSKDPQTVAVLQARAEHATGADCTRCPLTGAATARQAAAK